MELTVTLPKENWEYILEVISLVPSTQIKGVAINMLKPQLDKEFEESVKSEE